MSRCFPFPPPGYEKKPRSSDHGDLLAKEKHKEKKHKKEKKEKDREKRKERKEKDRSKDKDKEKKDRKEKHKDKKKDRDKDKDKAKSSSDDRRKEDKPEVHHEHKVPNDSHKLEAARDSRFAEELGRRIRAEEQQTASRIAEHLSVTPATGKESVTVNKKPTNTIGAVERRNDNVGPFCQKKDEGLERGTVTNKQQVARTEKVPDVLSAEGKRKDHLTPPAHKKLGNLGSSMAMEKQRAANIQKVDGFTSAEQRRNQAAAYPVDNYSSSIEKRIDMGKERSILPDSTGIDQRRIDQPSVPGEKVRSMDKERKEQPKEKVKDRKREGHDDKVQTEKKRKEKDKHRHKEKKTEEKIKAINGKNDILQASEMKAQIEYPNNKSSVPHIGNLNNAGVNAHNRKRKESEMNGFVHESQPDVRASKLLKASTSSSRPSLGNGNLEFIGVASPSSSIKLGAVNNAQRSLNNKDNHKNGNVDAQPLHPLRPPSPLCTDSKKRDELNVVRPEGSFSASSMSKRDAEHIPHIVGNSTKSAEIPSKLSHPPPALPVAVNSSKMKDRDHVKPPHPDAKYLSTIYSIPKIDESLEDDDHNWLFSSENPRSNAKLEDDGPPPQVWANGVNIETADVFALPYVVPF